MERAVQHRIKQSIWVDRPAQEAFEGWTDLDAIPLFTPGVLEVVAESPGRTRWSLRTLGLAPSTIVHVQDWQPGKRVSFATECGRLTGEVTFSPVNHTTTAVSVVGVYRPTSGAEVVVGTLGIPSGRVRRTLVRFKNWAEAQPRERQTNEQRRAG